MGSEHDKATGIASCNFSCLGEPAIVVQFCFPSCGCIFPRLVGSALVVIILVVILINRNHNAVLSVYRSFSVFVGPYLQCARSLNANTATFFGDLQVAGKPKS